MSSDLKKSPTCCALKQFIVPCPNHVLDVLIWKLSALQSFFNTASEWIQSGLFKMFLHDGVFCVGIAAARMNLFKDSLYNFASATKGFLLHYNIPVEFGSKNHSAQNLRFFELWKVETLISGVQPMKLLRQLKGCAPAAACECLRHLKTCEKFVSSLRHTVILKNHVSASSSFSWLLGSSTLRSYSILIPHAQYCLSVCWSNFKFKFIKLEVYIKNWQPFRYCWIILKSSKSFIPFNKALSYIDVQGREARPELDFG